jgi:hypothetical protein
VLLASHQLSSHTAEWWDAYVETHEEPESIDCWNLGLFSVHIMFPKE